MLLAWGRTRLEVAEGVEGCSTDENWEPKGSLWLSEREAWGQQGWDWEPCCCSDGRWAAAFAEGMELSWTSWPTLSAMMRENWTRTSAVRTLA